MKKILFIVIMAVVLVSGVGYAQDGAQRIEVTRAYVPSAAPAVKLDMAPGMTDTVTLKPDIAYSVTPTAWKTAFDTDPINPVRISTAAYRPERPFYLRAGIGAPLMSLLDFYATATTPPDWTLGAYVNHDARRAKMTNPLDFEVPAIWMTNVGGGYIQKTFRQGRTLTADVRYVDRYYTDYGGLVWPNVGMPSDVVTTGDMRYKDFTAGVSFGDIVRTDISKFNYMAAVSFGLFRDGGSVGQNDFRVRGGVGWGVWEGFLRIDGDFGFTQGVHGDDFMYDNFMDLVYPGSTWSSSGGYVVRMPRLSDLRIELSPKYELDYRDFRISAGLDINYNDHTAGSRTRIFPDVHIKYDGLQGINPYLDIDGGLGDGSYRALSYANPYVLPGLFLPNASYYGARIGADGLLWRTLYYDVSAGCRMWSDYSYFVNSTYTHNQERNAIRSRFTPLVNDSVDVFDLSVRLGAKVARGLTVDARARFNAVSQSDASMVYYTEDGVVLNPMTGVKSGLDIPACEFSLDVKYEYRNKFFIGAGVDITGRREVSSFVGREGTGSTPSHPSTDYDVSVRRETIPVAVNLRIDAEYRINARTGVFLRGGNLLNQHIYLFNHYQDMRANVMVGVKISF